MVKFSNQSKGIVLMLLSALCVCVGQLFWKLSAQEGIVYLILGFTLYGIGSLLMILAYRFGKVSVLQPVLSSSYILSLILAYYFLNEVIDIYKVIGVFLIILGIVVITAMDKK